MKTLQPGTLPTPRTWWSDVVVKCGVCGARAELDGNDVPVRIMRELHTGQNFDAEAYFACPTDGCDGEMVAVKLAYIGLPMSEAAS